MIEEITICSLLLIHLCYVDHPWLQNGKKNPNVSLGEVVKSRLKQFSVMNKLKKRALGVNISVNCGA